MRDHQGRISIKPGQLGFEVNTFMQMVISDPKTGKAYSKKFDGKDFFAGKRMHDTVKLDEIDMAGYEAEITGGSDKTGTPMKWDVQGTGRKKVFISHGFALKDTRKGLRRRITVRGNTVAPDVHQLNLKLTKIGSTSLAELFPLSAEKQAEESVKEKLLRESQELAKSGTVEVDPKSVKGKVRH